MYAIKQTKYCRSASQIVKMTARRSNALRKEKFTELSPTLYILNLLFVGDTVCIKDNCGSKVKVENDIRDKEFWLEKERVMESVEIIL